MMTDKFELANLVNPHMGGIGHLLTATEPMVLRPHGMMRVVPLLRPQGYLDHFLAEWLEGVRFDEFVLRIGRGAVVGSDRDHDWEAAHPYAYQVAMPSIHGHLDVTVSQHCLWVRLTATQSGEYWWELGSTGALRVEGGGTTRWSAATQALNTHRWLYVESSTGGRREEREGRPVIHYPLAAAETVEWRIGLSYVDVDAAKQHVDQEMPSNQSFEMLEAQAKAAWEHALGRLRVEGGSARQRATFYTCLYRSLSRMTNVSEDGRYYSGYDHRIHRDESDFYVNDGLWDTFRTMHPLQMLLEPDAHRNMVRSYVRMAEQSGWLPSFPRIDGEHPTMIGKHAIAMMADAMSKDAQGIDWESAYQVLKKSALEETRLPWRSGPLTAFDACYRDAGFYPALQPGEAESLDAAHPFERRQAVSVTLECAYDDWCLARMAWALGHAEDARRFSERAQNYRRLFNPTTGFMHPKDRLGAFLPNFDPECGGGQGGRDYFTEANSYIYSFHVLHDISGLIELMGGNQAFVQRLDDLFTIPPSVAKYRFLDQFPDSTGLMGQYPQGNEPSFHIPYLYNYAGAPWKTQRRIRELVRLWFNDGPLGVPGDEDGGAMSAWYVWSTLGIYPTCPGRPDYDIGSPLWDSVTFRPEGAPEFSITVDHAGDRFKYVKSARLNGRAVTRPQIRHSELVREGGNLHFDMSDVPHTLEEGQ